MSRKSLPLDRRAVLAHRFAVLGLDRRVRAPAAELAVVRLGVQDTPPGSLPVALAARLEGEPDLAGLTTVWSHRGAPHLHRTAALPELAAACWPVSDTDAAARLGWQRTRLAEVGMASRAAIRTVAEAVAEVLTEPMVKGELSAAVTARIPQALAPYCRPCGVHHVAEQLLRLAAFPAGAALRPGTRPVVLEPLPGRRGPPEDGEADPGPVVEVVLELLAPVSAADVAGFLGTSVAVVRAALPPDLVQVEVAGRAALCPPALVAAVGAAEPTGAVRLLPPSDPFLQGRDREVLVPDPAHRAAIWPALGPPGVLASAGEVLGTWRTRRKGRSLEVVVDTFDRVPGAVRAAAEEEAQRVAAVRGATAAVVRWE